MKDGERVEADKWASKWHVRALDGDPEGTVQVNGVKGYLSFGDLNVLFDAAAAVGPAGTIVEIGSGLGLSALVMAAAVAKQAGSKTKIYCVDTWQEVSGPQQAPDARNRSYGRFVENVHRAGVAEIVVPVRGDSIEVADGWPEHSADLIWIDGDHRREATLSNIEAWHRVAKPRGRVLGHEASPAEGVSEALEMAAEKYGMIFSVLGPPGAYYIWEMVSHGH